MDPYQHQDYPKMVTTSKGEVCLVPDAQTQAAVLRGECAIPVTPVSAQGSPIPIVPSIGPAPVAHDDESAARKRKKGT